MLKNLSKYDIVLASASPRRHALLKELGIEFRVEVRPVDETYPADLSEEEIAIFLSQLKADSFSGESFTNNELIITADTIVCLDGSVLGKPNTHEEAFSILSALSGKKHRVITGMCIKSSDRQVNFAANTYVYFKELSADEINYYIDRYKPFDKAGAYGIQEWIGYIGIEKIEGSFYNVMGLPVFRLYEELLKF
jgi:septum formation protein